MISGLTVPSGSDGTVMSQQQEIDSDAQERLAGCVGPGLSTQPPKPV